MEKWNSHNLHWATQVITKSMMTMKDATPSSLVSKCGLSFEHGRISSMLHNCSCFVTKLSHIFLGRLCQPSWSSLLHDGCLTYATLPQIMISKQQWPPLKTLDFVTTLGKHWGLYNWCSPANQNYGTGCHVTILKKIFNFVEYIVDGS